MYFIFIYKVNKHPNQIDMGCLFWIEVFKNAKY